MADKDNVTALKVPSEVKRDSLQECIDEAIGSIESIQRSVGSFLGETIHDLLDDDLTKVLALLRRASDLVSDKEVAKELIGQMGQTMETLAEKGRITEEEREALFEEMKESQLE